MADTSITSYAVYVMFKREVQQAIDFWTKATGLWTLWLGI